MDTEQLIIDAADRGLGLAGSGQYFTQVTTGLLKLLGRDFAAQLRPGDRPSMLLACGVAFDGGKESPGGVLFLDDRVIVGWTSGVFRHRTGFRVVPLADVTLLERTAVPGNRVTGARTVVRFRSPQGLTSLGLYAEKMLDRAVGLAEGMLGGGIRFTWGDDEPAEKAAPEPTA